MIPVNISEKFDLITEQWHPHIIGKLNGQHVKIAKIQGEFIWHSHEDEDELFYVIKGKLNLEFRDKLVTLHPGEMLVVPKGVEHKPSAEEETFIMMFEPVSTVNTGNAGGDRTHVDLPEI